MSVLPRIGIAAIAGAVLVVTGGRAADPVFDPEVVSAVWKAREEKVKTARFEYTYTIYYPKGGFSRQSPDYMEEMKIVGELPKSDYRLSTKARFALDGIKVRYDHTIANADAATRMFYLREEQEAFDGTHNRIICRYPQRNREDDGAVTKAHSFPDAGNVGVRALFGALRGRTKGLANVNLNACQPTGRRAKIDGTEAVELLIGKPRPGGVTEHVWLDPSKDWLPVRWTTDGPQDVRRSEIRYKTDPIIDWVPATWDFIISVQGATTCTYHYNVDRYELNVSIDESEFILRFPTGTRVLNEDAKQGFVGVVRQDGKLQPDDGTPAYALPGQATSWWKTASKYGLYCLPVLALLALVVRVVRRNRVKR